MREIPEVREELKRILASGISSGIVKFQYAYVPYETWNPGAYAIRISNRGDKCIARLVMRSTKTMVYSVHVDRFASIMKHLVMSGVLDVLPPSSDGIFRELMPTSKYISIHLQINHRRLSRIYREEYGYPFQLIDFDRNMRRSLKFLKLTENVADRKSSPAERFLASSRAGDCTAVKSILEKFPAVIGARERFTNRTSLHWSSAIGNVEICRLVISKGIEINAMDSDGSTSLHYAARFGHLEIAKQLIEHGANLDARGLYRQTPLHVAANKGNHAIFNLFIREGGSDDLIDQFGKTPRDYARQH